MPAALQTAHAAAPPRPARAQVAYTCVCAALPDPQREARQVVVLLNSAALREAVLQAAGAPDDEGWRSQVIKALLAPSCSEEHMRRATRGQMEVARLLADFAKEPWTPTGKRPVSDLWTWAVGRSEHARASAAVHAAQAEMAAVLRCLGLMGLTGCVEVLPLLPCGARESYAGGLRFDVRLRGTRHSLARGGRVDRALLRGRMGAGASIYTRALYEHAEKLHKPLHLAGAPRAHVRHEQQQQQRLGKRLLGVPLVGGLPVGECDVLVASVGPGLLDERVSIAAELWAAGVRARCLYNPVEISYEEQLAWAQAHRVGCLVIVREATKTTGLVKVKLLNATGGSGLGGGGGGLDLERHELGRYFQTHALHAGGAAHAGGGAGAGAGGACASGGAVATGGFAAVAAAAAAAHAAAANAAAAAAAAGAPGAGGGGGNAGTAREAGGAAGTSGGPPGGSTGAGAAGGAAGTEAGGGGGAGACGDGLTRAQRAKKRAQQALAHKRGGH